MTVAGLPELTQRYQKLNQKNNFFSQLNETLPWEEFRPILEPVRQNLIKALFEQRKSLSFSKKMDNHIGAIWYFIPDYNAQLAKH